MFGFQFGWVLSWLAMVWKTTKETKHYIESDSENEQEEEGFISKHFHKLQSHFKRSTAETPKISIEEERFTTVLSSSFQVPFLATRIDPETKGKPIPIIFAALDIVDIESENATSNILFHITVKYGDVTWTIHKRLLDILKLHSILTFREIQGHLPSVPHFPNQLSYFFDMTFFRAMSPEERLERKAELASDQIKTLEEYFLNLFCQVGNHSSIELCEFFEISPNTFRNSGKKGKEGYLKKSSHDSFSFWSYIFCFWRGTVYKKKWLALNESSVCYSNSVDSIYPEGVFLFDKYTQIEVKNQDSRNILKTFTIKLTNSNERMILKPTSGPQMSYWLQELESMSESSWCQTNRFDSFAPTRYRQSFEWIVDCKDYFEKVADALEAAETQIFIHGWWVSPEVYLKRPVEGNLKWRLDQILKRKAEQGIDIYIIIFKELAISLPIDSNHTKQTLNGLHPRIKVQRYPDQFGGGPLYWAMHEKIVIIDQKIGFAGGLDLAYGRYDTLDHKPIGSDEVWPGVDYANPCVKDFKNVSKYNENVIDRSTIPRMPWHDVSCQVQGQPVRDLARHFIQKWNFIKTKKTMHKNNYEYLVPLPDLSYTPGSCTLQVVRSSAEWSMGIPKETSIYSAYISIIKNSSHFLYIENQFFISNVSLRSSSPLRNRIAEAILDRIVLAHSLKQNYRIVFVVPLIPAFEAALDSSEATSARLIMQAQWETIFRGEFSLIEMLRKLEIEPDEYISFFSLRSNAVLNGKAVSEQVYVHTKLMIADDKIAIMGSANINDRAMLGNRDSEVCVIVEDEEQEQIKLDGKDYFASKKVLELRRKLLREHVGFAENDDRTLVLDDIVSLKFDRLLKSIASKNTEIYRKYLSVIPDDTIKNWKEYKQTKEAKLPDPPNGWNNDIQGNLVEYPTKFLYEEDLIASFLTLEYLLPIDVYL